MKKKYTPFQKGILTGFGFPGIGMSAAMFGYGVYAGEAGLDIYMSCFIIGALEYARNGYFCIFIYNWCSYYLTFYNSIIGKC